jgi:hypothetical protein
MANKTGEGIPIPSVIDPPESMAVTLCVPKNTEHLAAFFGALYQLTIWTSWQRNGTNEGKQVADVWWRYFLSWDQSISDTECEDGMSNCCVEPQVTRRVNPETGLIEQSVNGGASWSPAAGTLSSYIVEPIPPVTSGVAGTKCDAATNLSGQVDAWIEQVTNDFDTATSLLEFALAVLTAVLTAVVTLVTAATLTAAEALFMATLGAALTAAWGAGKTVFTSYWTTEIKDGIFCDAYCNIGENGSFTDVQFSNFWADCNRHMPASPAKMLFMGFLSSVGRQGVNAMAATGMAADSDCDDCNCDDCPTRPYVAPGGGTEISWEECTLTASSFPDGSYHSIYIWFDNPVAPYDPNACGTVTSYNVVSGSGVAIGYNDCVTGDNHLPPQLLPTGAISQLWFSASAPFTVEIYVGAP